MCLSAGIGYLPNLLSIRYTNILSVAVHGTCVCRLYRTHDALQLEDHTY